MAHLRLPFMFFTPNCIRLRASVPLPSPAVHTVGFFGDSKPSLKEISSSHSRGVSLVLFTLLFLSEPLVTLRVPSLILQVLLQTLNVLGSFLVNPILGSRSNPLSSFFLWNPTIAPAKTCFPPLGGNLAPRSVPLPLSP